MDNIQILEKIKNYNPWHEDSDHTIKTEVNTRDFFDILIKNYINRDISISISGLRRIGKTTILYQLINYFLEQKINSKKIFYFQFNNEFNNLESVLQLFFDFFSKQELQEDSFYIFLDELQNVKSWQNIIKYYVDKNKKIKFIVTGSTSIYAEKNVESLAGRIIDFRLHPLSFNEFLKLKYNYKNKLNFLELFLENDSKKIENLLQKSIYQKIDYQKYFQIYLRFGEYPGLLDSLDNIDFNSSYLKKSILEKILEKDIKIFEVEKEKEIKDLFKIACANSAQTINYREVSRQTLISYYNVSEKFNILEKIYLIDLVDNYLKSIRNRIGSQNKIFCNSINLLNSTLSIDDPLNPMYAPLCGHIIESYVYNAIKHLGDVFYFLKNKKEVDLILVIKGQVIPIEVKSRNSLKKTDINHLLFYLEKNNLEIAYVIYGGDVQKIERQGKTIFAFPYWLI